MKIAITGGGNVYALNFARYLSEIGIEHFGIGRSGPKPKPLWQVDHHYRFTALHLVDQLPAYLAILDTERPDVVVNFAAQGEGAASFGDHCDYYYTTNTVALVRLVEALRKRDYVKRFVQIGSSEVYGSVGVAATESTPLKPSSPYAISKAAFDQHLEIMYRVHGFPMNVIRPSNAYCPGQQLHRIIPQTIIKALSGGKVRLHGGGRAEKSYLHADDLSRAIVAVLERGIVGMIYNCGPEEPISIRELVRLTLERCGVRWEDAVEETADRVGQDGRYWLYSSALKTDTGWYQAVSLPHGLTGMVDWVKAYPELLAADTTFKLRA